MAELAFTGLKDGSAQIAAIKMSTSRRAAVWLASFLATFTAAGAALACPNCPVGRAARQQVCDDGLAQNLAIALVPFLLVGMVSAWAERIGKAR
jgi:hypothetical protein